MTDYSFSETESLSDYSVSEDESTSEWIDKTIADAATGGYLAALSTRIEEAPDVTPDEYGVLVAEAMNAGSFVDDRPDFVPPVAPNRDAVRAAIFAKVRRPDGTPFAQAYQPGPASRKAEYDGEDTRAAWWGPEGRWDDDYRTTRYEDRATIDDRAASRGSAGIVVDATGAPIDGRWAWVIDEAERALLLFNPNDNEWFDDQGNKVDRGGASMLAMFNSGYKMRAMHHTSPVAGMPVTGAGMITLDHGVIIEITDESGHYRPDAAQQHAAVEALAADRYDLSQADVRLTGRVMGDRPTDKSGWLDAAQATNAGFPTDDVSLTVQQFRQTQGDEYQIRMKQALNEQIGAQGDRPNTQYYEAEGRGARDPRAVGDLDTYDDSSDSSSDSEDSGPGAPAVVVRTEIVTLPNGRRQRVVHLSGGGYRLEDVEDDDPQDPLPQASESDDTGSASGRDRSASRSSSVSDEDSDDDPDAMGDSSAEEADDTEAQYIQTAKDYLADAGHPAFVAWFQGLDAHWQDTLLRDPELGAAWRRETAPPAAAAWQPAAADLAAAANANAASVDTIPDRGTANFTVAGLALLIGGGHSQQLTDYVGTVPDRVTGSVTVRKAAIGRGAGTLVFRGVPPAKQEIVRTEVARFSRKDVRFE